MRKSNAYAGFKLKKELKIIQQCSDKKSDGPKSKKKQQKFLRTESTTYKKLCRMKHLASIYHGEKKLQTFKLTHHLC